MKAFQLYLAVYFLLLSIVLLTSCKGQENAALSKGRAAESVPVAGDTIAAGSQTHTFPFDQYATFDAASQIAAYVVEIFEDKKGNLWFGTMAKGAVRYDGTRLTYFTIQDGLCGNTVASIAQDKAGNMWFGTHTGASRYDGKTFTSFTSKEGLHGMGCNILVAGDGTIWAGTNDGVFRYDDTKLPSGKAGFSKFDIPEPVIANPSYKWVAGKVWSLIEDKAGNIWFGRDGFGACRYDGTSFTHFSREDGLCSNNVSSIVEDSAGNIWFGALTSDFPEYIKEGGISRYDGNTFTKYPETEGLSANDIYSIYEDKKGHIWIGAIGYGAYRYDGNTFTLFKETDRADLTTNFAVQSILEDTKGQLWFGFSGGLFRFNGTSFVNVTQGGPWK